MQPRRLGGEGRMTILWEWQEERKTLGRNRKPTSQTIGQWAWLKQEVWESKSQVSCSESRMEWATKASSTWGWSKSIFLTPQSQSFPESQKNLSLPSTTAIQTAGPCQFGLTNTKMIFLFYNHMVAKEFIQKVSLSTRNSTVCDP